MCDFCHVSRCGGHMEFRGGTYYSVSLFQKPVNVRYAVLLARLRSVVLG